MQAHDKPGPEKGDSSKSTPVQFVAGPESANAQSAELQFKDPNAAASSAHAQSAELSPTRAIQAHAQEGISGSGRALPFQKKIQASFGSHDISGVTAHTGKEAAEANRALGSKAYATGQNVALGPNADLHTVAHEAAHTVQQKAGVQLKGGVGQAGDKYEQHADAVADLVVQGKSSEGLLSEMSGSGGGGAVQAKGAIQFIGTPLDTDLPATAEKPQYGEDKGEQRRYSREQYIELWEQEQGRKMTSAESDTIKRGCIGITAANLRGGGNPLDSAVATYGDFATAIADMKERNATANWWSNLPVVGGMFSDLRYVVFAKLFWSNQDKTTDVSKPDPNAFLADPNTGKIDMTGYNYVAQPGFVNFDYGFWDESTQSFWHANHMEYSDPAKQAADPMKVLQSTKDKFAAGYVDFDRIVYGVALAENYDPGLAAIANAGN